MNLGETISFLRRNEGLLQKDVYLKVEKLDASIYSKIENNKRNISLAELDRIAHALNTSLEEIISLCDFNDSQHRFSTTFFACVKNFKNLKTKRELLSYYITYEKSEKLTLKELSNYIAIKRVFNGKWKEITAITEDEIFELQDYLLTRNFFTQYDYILLLNLSPYFDYEKVFELFNNAFPIEFEEQRSYKTIITAANAALSLASNLIQSRDDVRANLIIEQIRKKVQVNDLMFKLDLEYLNNLVLYSQTKKRMYIDKISNYIRFLEDVGEVGKAKEYDIELASIIENTNKSIRSENNHIATYFFD